jgi:hypothetical protein
VETLDNTDTIDLPGIPHVTIIGQPGVVYLFAGLLQEGVRIPGKTDISLERLLTDEFGIEPAYIARRISTVFLNGSCVDDLGTARVRDGDVLALSSGMPGLAGASLRRGGPLAALRSGITLALDSPAGSGPSYGTIVVKLFNVLMAELGPGLLSRGLLIQKTKLMELLDTSPKAFRDCCDRASIDGRTVSVEKIGTEIMAGEGSEVFLRVLIPA